MKTIQIHKLSEGMSITPFRHLPLCEGCIFGKQSRQKFPHSASQTERRLQLVHSELCGSMPTTSLDSNKYLSHLLMIIQDSHFYIFESKIRGL